ncbi:MAG: uracil-DNA glycosylase [Fusobacteriaceae bacterium]|jgi:DNA polymerase|nr:uracil-DNA glycosylase [Fusobacteriaceae bacterium]
MDYVNDLWEDLLYELKKIKNPIVENVNDEIIVGSGNREAKVVFIGDDSSLYENDDLKVSPGSSGEFLFKLCDLRDIKPNNYYVTTLTKRNCKYRDFLDKDRGLLKELLDMQLSLINPKIIVALGSEVANLLFAEEIDFNKLRGNVMNLVGDTEILITYDVKFAKKSRHEAGKNSKVATDFWNDLNVLKKELDKINGASE